MNELARELEDKANSLFNECTDLDLLEAAIYMMKAAQCVKSYEVKLRKRKHDPDTEK